MFGTKNKGEKPPLNEENILNKVSEYDIFKYYIGDFTVGRVFSSPLHKDDNPSFGIFAGKQDGKLMFNDYVKGGGSCFTFVMYLFGVDYWSALNIVNNDMRLGLQSSSKVTRVVKDYTATKKVPKIKNINIGITKREWNSNDALYWQENYSISLNTLQKFRVIPISSYRMNGITRTCGPLGYAYYLAKGTFKIYQPNLPSHQGKWWSNVNVGTPWQGFHTLPKEGGDLLFITSSMKDAMTLYELEYYAIAPHTEHQLFNDKIYKYFSERWDKIVIFYDHDKAGIGHAKRWAEEFNLPYITTGSERFKDPSDYVKMNSLGMLDSLIIKQLNGI